MTNGKYCHRCGRVHNSPPVDVEKMKDDHAKELAAEIDRQVLDEIMRRAILKSGKLIDKGRLKKND